VVVDHLEAMVNCDCVLNEEMRLKGIGIVQEDGCG
jgi:hypothetical protein